MFLIAILNFNDLHESGIGRHFHGYSVLIKLYNQTKINLNAITMTK